MRLVRDQDFCTCLSNNDVELINFSNLGVFFLLIANENPEKDFYNFNRSKNTFNFEISSTCCCLCFTPKILILHLITDFYTAKIMF